MGQNEETNLEQLIDSEAIYEHMLENRLEKLNQSYYLSYSKIKSKRASDYSTISNQEGTFVTHGPTHINQILKKLGHFLESDGIEKLNELELYSLLCAITLHDISMGYLHIRNEHPEKSAEIVEKDEEYHWIDNDIKYIVGDIIRSHGIVDFENDLLYSKYPSGYSKHIDGKQINVGALMSLLRIGDLLDWANDRAPQKVREGIPVVGESFYYWYSHAPIKNIIPNKEEHKITISGCIFNKYSCRVLKRELEMLNTELATNKGQLSKIGLLYENFSFDIETNHKVKEALKPEKSEEAFRPFISYNEQEYLKLQGRDRDEEQLIRITLKSREEHSIPILTAASGEGKTSILKARVLQDFRDMGFESILFDDVSECLKYFDNTFEIDDVAKEDNKTNRYIVIIDQMERNFVDSKKNDLERFFNRLKKYVSEETYKKRIIYFVIAVPDWALNTLGQKLSSYSIETRNMFLNQVDIRTVVTSILKTENIHFDKEIVNEIIDQLRSSKKADITNAHILFSMILKIDSKLLVDKGLIVQNYTSINSMIEEMIEQFFSDKFAGLTEMDKAILKRACNYAGNGTHRVHSNPAENNRLNYLVNNHFIRKYPGDNTYEFVHDILAKKFYDDVLGEYEKEISRLLEKIHNDSLDRETLISIQKNREEISHNDLSDSDITNLIFAYTMNKSSINEADFWMSYYSNPESVIICLVQRIERSVIISGMTFISMPLLSRKVNLLIERTRSEEDHQRMLKQLMLISKDSSSYRRQCISTFILDQLGDNVLDNTVEPPIGFTQTYQQVLIEPEYDYLFKELYCYLMHYNLVDSIIYRGQLSYRHYSSIIRIFSSLDKNSVFYTYEIDDATINKEKYDKIISLIIPSVVRDTKTTRNKNVFTLLNSKVIIENKKVTYYKKGIRTTLHSSINSESLLIFVYNEEVDILFYTDEPQKPLLYLKKNSSGSHAFFSKIDICRIIRSYKLVLSNNDYFEHYEEISPVVIPVLPDGSLSPFASIIVKGALDGLYDREPRDTDNDEKIKEITTNPKLAVLFRLLCYVNYLSVKFGSDMQFDHAHIVLLQTDEIIKGTDLYDNYYVEYYGNNKTATYDPIKVSGINHSKDTYIDFTLLSDKDYRNVNYINIKKEIEFCNNASPAIAVGIGAKTDSQIERYKDSFSFKLMWDDKVNLVSQALDAWEYELNKILVVLNANPFITDIFIFGNAVRCKKTMQILLKYCKHSDATSKSFPYADFESNTDSINMQYFKENDFSKLSNITLHIIYYENDVSEAEIEMRISEFFLKHYTKVLTLELNHLANTSANDVKAICEQYLRSINAYSDNDSHSICVQSIDDAYKAMLASLICFGKQQIDSAGKEVLDIRGCSLIINNIQQNGYTLSYRRSEIDEYYRTQWQDEQGVIKKIADSTEIFNVNQMNIIKDELESTIKKGLGNRKLTISFYKPDEESISKFKTPSLLNCFLFPRYENNECYIDAIFIWRTNECVLGLPMSIEASIRWVTETLLPRVEVPIKMGDYIYFGANMHCSDNFIMHQMILNIISPEEKQEKIID